MQITEFRNIQSRVLLSTDGGVPQVPQSWDDEERDAALDRISRAWELVEKCPINGHKAVSRIKLTNTESWTGMKRWYLGHHQFIGQLALIDHCLSEAARAMTEQEAEYWTNLASRLRKGCGALFLYGIDFEPCAPIYCGAIRSSMPPAFSGFWIRERHHFQPALVRFKRAFPEETDNNSSETPRRTWDVANSRYDYLHEQSMHLAVPDGKSLAGVYREENLKPHKISEAEFEEYDEWFCIERSPTVTRLDYILQVCDLIERVTADLMSGHRLDAPVMTELLDGMKAAMVVFGNWVGPVPERSRFYPKCFRGE